MLRRAPRALMLAGLAGLALATMAGCSDKATVGGAVDADAEVEVGEPDVAPPEDSGPPPQICPPGVAQNVCPSAVTITRCNAEGTAWEEAGCPPNEFCFAGSCESFTCPPGVRLCTDPKTLSVCVDDGEGDFEWITLEACDGLCSQGRCIGACGFDIKDQSGKPCEFWTLNLTALPESECDGTHYLAVPSSAASQVAVFDLSQSPPALEPGSPFETCANPSRILMTPDTEVLVTCRDDGRVARHGRDGTERWSVVLPESTAVRGVVRTGDGRVFAGSSTTGNVHELDWETGAVVDTAWAGHGIYGMAADPDAIYALELSGGLSKLTWKAEEPGGEAGLHQVWRIEDVEGYGLATDDAGRIWVSAPPGLAAYSTADGELLTIVSLIPPDGELPGDVDAGIYCNGVAVGVDGRVVVGCGGPNVVWVHDPGAGTKEALKMPEGAAHPRGVAVDVQGNIYSINLDSHNVTRFDVTTGQASSFDGGGALDGPYGYSGDLTSLSECLFGASPTWWHSEVQDFGEDETLWISVRWRATVPDGTSLKVWYRVDEGPWVQTLSGLKLNATGRRFQVRARLASSVPEAVPVLESLAVDYELP